MPVSGTTGKPTVVGYTKRDIETWTELMARSFFAAGAHKRDVIHNAYGYGLFTGGLGAHYGAERIGASVIPMSGGNTKKQLMIMQDFGSTVLTCTPSYSLFLAESQLKRGLISAISSSSIGIFGAEPWSEKMREEIEASSILKPSIFTGFLKSSGRASALSATKRRTACMSGKIIFCWKLLIPTPRRCCPTVKKGNWSLPPSPKRGFL
jgi:phenylacetate-CoA ligase